MNKFFKMFFIKPLLKVYDNFPAPLTISITFIGYLCLFLNRKPLSLVKAKLQEELHFSTIWLGWLDTSFSIFHAIGLFLLPVLIKRYYNGTLNFLILLLFITVSLTVFLFSISQNSILLLFFWGFHGFIESLVFPILVTLITRKIPPYLRPTVFCFWGTAQQFGALASIFLSGKILIFLQWRFLFIIPSLMTFIMGLILFKFLPTSYYLEEQNSYENTEEIKLKNITKKPENASKSYNLSNASNKNLSKNLNPINNKYAPLTEDREQFKRFVNTSRKDQKLTNQELISLIISPEIFYISLAYFFIKLIRYAMVNWLPFLIVQIFNFSSIESSYLATFYDIGYIFGAFFIGFLSSFWKKGSSLIVKISISIFVLGLVFMTIPFIVKGNFIIFCFCLLSIGIFLSGPDILISSVMPQLICERKCLSSEFGIVITGIIGSIGTLGTIAHGYLVAGIISSVYGWPFLFLCFAFICMLSMVLLIYQHYSTSQSNL